MEGVKRINSATASITSRTARRQPAVEAGQLDVDTVPGRGPGRRRSRCRRAWRSRRRVRGRVTKAADPGRRRRWSGGARAEGPVRVRRPGAGRSGRCRRATAARAVLERGRGDALTGQLPELAVVVDQVPRPQFLGQPDRAANRAGSGPVASQAPGTAGACRWNRRRPPGGRGTAGRVGSSRSSRIVSIYPSCCDQSVRRDVPFLMCFRPDCSRLDWSVMSWSMRIPATRLRVAIRSASLSSAGSCPADKS